MYFLCETSRVIQYIAVESRLRNHRILFAKILDVVSKVLLETLFNQVLNSTKNTFFPYAIIIREVPIGEFQNFRP